MTYHSINFYDDTIIDKVEYFNFLKHEISPIIQKLESNNPAFKYFFVRYSDEIGSHLRIRFRNINESDLTDLIESDNRIKVSIYEPEFERYGGEENIFVSEFIFEISSQTILYLINNTANWSYENSLLFSVAFNSCLINRNRILKIDSVLENTILFWNNQTLQIETSLLWEKLENNYKSNKVMIKQSFDNAVNILKDLINQDDLFFYEKLSHLTPNQIEVVVESLIHMSNNRFGIFNFDEVLTNYYLIQLVNDGQ